MRTLQENGLDHALEGEALVPVLWSEGMKSTIVVNNGWNLRIGAISQLLTPGYGSCLKCKTTWVFVSGHSTQYSRAFGCFPLCEPCWVELETPERRLPYYRQHWELWQESDSKSKAEWEQIEAAVQQGG